MTKAGLPMTVEWADNLLELEVQQAKQRHAKRLSRISSFAKKPPALRHDRALELRRSGKTFREIGELLGVGKQRAEQIVKRAELDEQRGALKELSVRARNVIATFANIYDWQITPVMVSKMSRERLFEEPNIGPHTLSEIEFWLTKHSLKMKP